MAFNNDQLTELLKNSSFSETLIPFEQLLKNHNSLQYKEWFNRIQNFLEMEAAIHIDEERFFAYLLQVQMQLDELKRQEAAAKAAAKNQAELERLYDREYKKSYPTPAEAKLILDLEKIGKAISAAQNALAAAATPKAVVNQWNKLQQLRTQQFAMLAQQHGVQFTGPNGTTIPALAMAQAFVNPNLPNAIDKAMRSHELANPGNSMMTKENCSVPAMLQALFKVARKQTGTEQSFNYKDFLKKATKLELEPNEVAVLEEGQKALGEDVEAAYDVVKRLAPKTPVPVDNYTSPYALPKVGETPKPKPSKHR